MYFWNKSVRDEAEKVLADLLRCQDSHNWIHAPQHELDFRALASLASSGWPNGCRLHWTHLREPVNTMIAANSVGLDRLEIELSEWWKEIATQRTPVAEVLVTVPLAVAEMPDFPVQRPATIRTPSLEFSIVDVVSVAACAGLSPAEFERCNRRDQILLQHACKIALPTTCARTVVNAAGPQSAIQIALSELDALRTTANFFASTGSIAIQLTQRSRAAIGRSAWAVAVIREEPPSLFSVTLDSVSISDVHAFDPWRYLVTAEQFLGEFLPRLKTGSTALLAFNAMRLFSQAQEQRDWHFTLLGLWQVAEMLTAPGRAHHRHGEVAQLLATLCESSDLTQRARVRLALKPIMEARHRIVHEGDSSMVSEPDVRFLEDCCKSALIWYLRQHESFPSLTDLKQFFRLA